MAQASERSRLLEAQSPAEGRSTPNAKRAVKPPRKRPSLVPDVPEPGLLEIEAGESDEVFRYATGDQKYDSWWHSMLCPCAERAGNMSILFQVTSPSGDRRPIIVAGPYWPVMLCVTFPVVVLMSLLYASAVLPLAPPLARVLFWVFTTWCCILLFVVGLSDPGLLRRRRVKPEGCESWRFSGQAQTFRPTHALYSRECNAVIQGFDHVCPWTGTAIGAGNEAVFDLFRNSMWLLVVFEVYLAIACHVAKPSTVVVGSTVVFLLIVVLLAICFSCSRTRSSIGMH